MAEEEGWPQWQLPPEAFLDSNKVRVVSDLMAAAGKAGSKVVAFSQFTSVLDLLEVAAAAGGWKWVRLDGSTPVPQRMTLVDAFQRDPAVRLFLASARAGGVGLNLTAANVAVLLDPDFNPTVDAQCEDRIHRIGQRRPCVVLKVATRRSIETHIAAIAGRKAELQGAVLHMGKGAADAKAEEAEALRRALAGAAPVKAAASAGGGGRVHAS